MGLLYWLQQYKREMEENVKLEKKKSPVQDLLFQSHLPRNL
jgi:hypothetical protein